MVTNPSKGIKLIPVEELATQWLPRPQQAAFVRALQAGKSLRDLAVCGLMLHAGLQVSEVCALTREDLVLRQRSGEEDERFTMYTLSEPMYYHSGAESVGS